MVRPSRVVANLVSGMESDSPRALDQKPEGESTYVVVECDLYLYVAILHDNRANRAQHMTVEQHELLRMPVTEYQNQS